MRKTNLRKIHLGVIPCLFLVVGSASLAQQNTPPAPRSTRAPSVAPPERFDSRPSKVVGADERRFVSTTGLPPSHVSAETSPGSYFETPSAPCHADCHPHRGFFGRIKGWWNRRRNRCGCHACPDCGAHGHASDDMPLGYFLNEHFATQISNGEAARMVLYRYDFIDGTARLKLKGKRRLAEIAKMIPTNFHPVVIQQTVVRPSGDSETDQKRQLAADALDRMRRDAVLEALREMTIPVPEERVRVGYPIVPGLRGDEEQAQRVYGNLLVPDDGGLGLGASETPATGAVGTP